MAAARKARQSVESGSICKNERSNLGETKATPTTKLFAEQQHRNQFPGPLKIERPYLLFLASIPQVRGRRARRTRPRENTRRRPAHATLEGSGRKINQAGREAKASGVPDKVEDKIGILRFAVSGREG